MILHFMKADVALYLILVGKTILPLKLKKIIEKFNFCQRLYARFPTYYLSSRSKYNDGLF